MADTRVIREVPTLTTDVDVFGTVVNSPIILASAMIAAGSPLNKSKVVEIQFEYEADAAQTLLFEYTTDEGTTWVTYSSRAITATLGPSVLAIRKTITHHNIQLRLRSTVLGQLRIISMTPRIVLEGKVSP